MWVVIDVIIEGPKTDIPETPEGSEPMFSIRVVLLVFLLVPAVPVAFGAGPAAPAPVALSMADLPEPCPWATRIVADDPVPLEFSVDLDLFAPLGAKSGNGAIWFAAFAKNIGDRRDEVEAAQASTVTWEYHGKARKVLPPDHPLLIEAEPWMDVAVWSFYPEVWNWQGGPTPISNLLFALQLGRSWIARGQTAEDADAATADYRRTIRLGRLLLQDDVVYIQNLIGIALVRNGVEAIYDHAQSRGDCAMTALAALALQDCTALRLELMRRFQRLLIFNDFVARVGAEDGERRTELRLPDGRFETLVETAVADPSRALRIEAVTPLWITSHLGTDTQRKIARETLTALRSDPDELVSTAATLMLDRPFIADDVEAHWGE